MGWLLASDAFVGSGEFPDLALAHTTGSLRDMGGRATAFRFALEPVDARAALKSLLLVVLLLGLDTSRLVFSRETSAGFVERLFTQLTDQRQSVAPDRLFASPALLWARICLNVASHQKKRPEMSDWLLNSGCQKHMLRFLAIARLCLAFDLGGGNSVAPDLDADWLEHIRRV